MDGIIGANEAKAEVVPPPRRKLSPRPVHQESRIGEQGSGNIIASILDPQTSNLKPQTSPPVPWLRATGYSSIKALGDLLVPEAKADWSEPLAHYDRVHFYHTDHLGSTRLVTDRDGQIFERTDYLPFGEIFRDDVASGPDTNYQRDRFKFTGQMYDYLTNLYYYGARYYDPEIGRFTQADTIVPRPLDGQTFNRYTYCANNPYKFADPTGHFALLLTGFLLGAIFAIAGAIIGGFIGAVYPRAFGTNSNGEGFWTGAAYGAALGFSWGMMIGSLSDEANFYAGSGDTPGVENQNSTSKNIKNITSGEAASGSTLGEIYDNIRGDERMNRDFAQAKGGSRYWKYAPNVAPTIRVYATSEINPNTHNGTLKYYQWNGEMGTYDHVIDYNIKSGPFKSSDYRKALAQYNADHRDAKIPSDSTLPAGLWDIGPVGPGQKGGMTDSKGLTWAMRLSPKMVDMPFPRSGFYIHPDGGPVGTHGCLGLEYSDTSGIRGLMNALYSIQGGDIPLWNTYVH